VPQGSGATKGYGDLGTRRDAEDMRFATGMRLDRCFCTMFHHILPSSIAAGHGAGDDGKQH
jgi:hypothetical protein